MRFAPAAVPIIVIAALTGCGWNVHDMDDRGPLNAKLVNALPASSIDNAIIRQSTIFPYHFVTNTSRLNELGEHDLGVLAGHYRRERELMADTGTPGQNKQEEELSVRRDDTPEKLYEARVETVIQFLQEGGVETDGVTIGDALPGGDGMISERVLLKLTEFDTETAE